MQRLKSIATVCVFLSVTIVLYRDPFLLLWWPQEVEEKTDDPGLPLDLAPECIDEMFDGCKSEVAATMIDVFGVFEWNFNKNFANAWALVENQIQRPVPEPLTEDHSISLQMYTNQKTKLIQRDFTNVLRYGKDVYNTPGFRFHYFYFYLIDAIQRLHQIQTTCVTTYYGTGKQYQMKVNHTLMRFGQFVWAQQDKNLLLPENKISCFEIFTCFGADISDFSAVSVKGQILIPPYEVFEITDVQSKSTWCDVIYKLRSTKIPRSNFNCKMNLGQTESHFFDILRHWRLNFIWLILVFIFVFIYAVFIKQWCRCYRPQSDKT